MDAGALADIAAPIALDGGGRALHVGAQAYVTGGSVVVTTADERVAAALAVSGAQAVLELKDVDAFALRNRKFGAAGAETAQLPLATTPAGRVLVNPPGLLPDEDERVAGSALTVFGGVRAGRATLDSLVVDEMLSPAFVRGVAVASGGGIVVTRGDGTTSDLPVGWDAIRGKPATFPVDAAVADAIPYLTDRVRLAQFNVDYLLAEVTRLQADVGSLERVAVDSTAFGPDPRALDLERVLRERLEAGVRAARRGGAA